MQLEETVLEDNLILAVAGSLDESAATLLAGRATRCEGRHVEVRLNGVEAVNSIGVRALVDYLRQLAKRTTFELRGCPPVFVEYLNLLASTLHAGQVASFQIPYACSGCGRQETPEFERRAHDWSKSAPQHLCPGCKEEMGVAVDLADYLEFLSFKAS